MSHDAEPRAHHQAPALADDPEDALTDHGRVGYGRIGRYTPLALGLLLVLVVAGIWWTQRDTNTNQPGIGPVEAAFSVPSAYPSTVVIGPDGVVDGFQLGPLTAERLRW